LALLPPERPGWKDPSLAERWRRLLAVRGEVTKALEKARVEKRIGHPLDAAVTLYAEGDLGALIDGFGEAMRAIFIVSQVEHLQGKAPEGAWNSEALPGFAVTVAPASGSKCARCWVRDPRVGEPPGGGELCPRCAETLENLP
jgi:isoleucyl-tRNA synthetase